MVVCLVITQQHPKILNWREEKAEKCSRTIRQIDGAGKDVRALRNYLHEGKNSGSTNNPELFAIFAILIRPNLSY
jgi:hypothetical protein